MMTAQQYEGKIALLQLEKAMMEAEMARLKEQGPAVFVGVKTSEEKEVPVSREIKREERFHVTTAEMRALILARPHGRVELALLKLDSLQTSDEKRNGETLHKNARGFSKKHYTARTKRMLSWIRSNSNNYKDGKRHSFSFLTNTGGTWFLDAQVIVMSYCRQLAEIANEEGNCEWLSVK